MKILPRRVQSACACVDLLPNLTVGDSASTLLRADVTLPRQLERTRPRCPLVREEESPGCLRRRPPPRSPRSVASARQHVSSYRLRPLSSSRYPAVGRSYPRPPHTF